MSTTGNRFEGTLKKWDVERGFGFVVAAQGGQDVFVHVSAFPRDGHQPIVGEPLTFEIERDRDGRKRAARVQRPGVSRPMKTPGHRRPVRIQSRASWSLGTALIALLLVAALGGYAYNQYGDARSRAVRLQSPPQDALAAQPPPERSSFQCDGRLHCSQMTSCIEAKFFLKNCPGTQMDGNNDGVPCEKQWCNGLFGG